MQTLIRLLAYTGIRDGEAFALDRVNIDRPNRLLRIRDCAPRQRLADDRQLPAALLGRRRDGDRGGRSRRAATFSRQCAYRRSRALLQTDRAVGRNAPLPEWFYGRAT
jgi:integrase